MKKYIIYFLLLLLYVNLNAQEIDTTQNEKIYANKMIECINQFSSAVLYQIYINIDLMHNNSDITDNYELFDNMLFILENQLLSISDYLDSFNKCKLFDKKEFEEIFKIKGIIFDLNEDISLFREYLNDNNEDNFAMFFKYHQKIYIKLTGFYLSFMDS